MPNDDACRHRDVHRMFCTELRYLNASVRCINNLLVNTFNLITKNNSILSSNNRLKILKKCRSMSLFDGVNLIAVSL